MISRLNSIVPIALVALSGCAPEGLPGIVPVRGVVTLDGTPLPSGEVRYLPDSPDGRMARGRIGEDGRFELTTLRQGDGALPGEYDIIILAPAEEAPEDAVARRVAENSGPRRKRFPADEGPPSLIPLRYTNPDSSGLQDQVNRDHDGSTEIKLTSEP